MRSLLICFLIVLCASNAYSQYSPAIFDTLNYTSVLFEFPWVNGAGEYEVLVKNKSTKLGDVLMRTEANKLVIDNLEFGQDYSWRVRGITALGDKMEWSQENHFTIGTTPFVDDQKYRFRGKKLDRSRATKGLLFFDYGKIGVNRSGKPIWYLPEKDSLRSKTLLRDLKMTEQGTFTALFGKTAIEFDRQGNTLWQAPDNGKVNGEEREHYHHEFTKLPSGNYLVLGLDHVMRKLPNQSDSISVEFGTIIEYTPDGEVAWFWNSNDYFTDADLFSRPRGKSFDVRTHMNACSTDGEFVFASFRDISRIVVIQKKTGKVVESYGGYGVFSEPHFGTGFFRRQHSALQLSDGKMAVLNNDSIIDPAVVSSVVLFSRRTTENDYSEKIMDFKMDFDTLTNGKSAKTGNVAELENGNLLVNLGSINRAIELTRDGDVVWSMFMEQYDTIRKTWKAFPQYRVSHGNNLYPYVFSARLNKNRIIKKKRSITIRVYNVGNKTDNYSIFYAKKRKQIKVGELTIPSGKFKDFHFKTKGKKAIQFSVSSLHTPNNEVILAHDF